MPSYAIRLDLPPSNSSLLLAVHLSHNFYPNDPTLHTKQTNLDNFCETPVRHMSSQKPPSQPSADLDSIPDSVSLESLALSLPSVPEYDHNDPIGLIKHLRVLEIAAGRPDPFPTPLLLLCARVGCGKVGSLKKRCSKCFVACYCCVEWQREDWPPRKKRVSPALLILRATKDRKKLEALAKLSGREEGFGDDSLYLEARKILLPLLEKAHEAGEGVTEEEVLDGVIVLRRACMWMNDFDGSEYCFVRAKEGYNQLLPSSAKSVDVACALAMGLSDEDKMMAELRRFWEKAKVSLPDAAVTYTIANQLGMELKNKGEFEDAKALHPAALEGQRRVLREEHKKTLASQRQRRCSGSLWMVTRSRWERIMRKRRDVQSS